MKRILFATAVTLSALYILVTGLAILTAHAAVAPIQSFKYIGNFPTNVDEVSKENQKPEVRFAVLGDVQDGFGTAKKLLESARLKKCDFIIQTGDLVNYDEFFHYQMILGLINETCPDIPFLSVPGNHDVKNGYTNFSTFFGQTQFDFFRNNIHFIIMDNAMAPFSLDYLRALLEKGSSRKASAQIVFSHRPVDESPLREKFLALLKEFNVAYFFCGHVHEFSREEMNGTVFVVNGRGGDYDKDSRMPSGHAVLVESANGKLKDSKIEVPAEFSWYWAAIHVLYGHIYAGLIDFSLKVWAPLSICCLFLALVIVKKLFY